MCILLGHNVAVDFRHILNNLPRCRCYLSCAAIIAPQNSAVTLSNWYGKRIAELDKKGAADSEMKPVPKMPTRVGTVPVAVVNRESGE